MRDIVAAPDFLKDNYLSTDARIPVTLLRTNACSPLGTNAIRGNIWDNFSSSTYKDLPSVGKITVQDPVHRRPLAVPRCRAAVAASPACPRWSASGRRRRFCSTTGSDHSPTDPSVDSRMKVFNASIEQLLWPEKRQQEPGFDGYIARTTERSSVNIPKRNIPVELSSLIHGLPPSRSEQALRQGRRLQARPNPERFPDQPRCQCTSRRRI